jgi:ribonuclease HII
VLEYERQHWCQGITRLAGVDEAGRGPLAGPVVAGAVLMPPDYAESEFDGIFSRLTDSKKLTEKRREEFFSLLNESTSVEIGVGISTVEEIDEINILRATHLAMARAVDAIKPSPEYVLVDGLPVKGLSCQSTAIVKGDSKSLLIAAASVIAKVTRDYMMLELDEQYPGYGFARHKGYGTKIHMAALKSIGASPVHRKSFAPVREVLGLGQQKMGF